MNVTKIVILAAIAAAFANASAADIVGAQSAGDGGDHIEVGKSNVPFGPHTMGKAGIGVSNTFLFKTSMKVDFAGLAKSSKTTGTNTDGTTVYQLHNPIVDTNPFHRQLGDFNFVKIGKGDLWIGEWSRNNANNFDGRQVYYVGEHGGTTMPEGGVATYKTYGVNKFNGDNLLTGNLTADFGANKLSGEIANQTSVLELAADIKSDASFKGDAVFNGSNGTTHGHFFGSQAAALAGIAEFSDNRDLNTAFGGTKEQ